jgi:threonine aldolase
MFFASDNGAGATPAVLNALIKANDGYRAAYGNDDETREVENLISALFEKQCYVFLVSTGTAANALALSALTPPWGAVLAHKHAHIVEDECGAPEFYMHGARLIPIDGVAGKLTASGVEQAISSYSPRVPHAMPLKAISLTQSTETGGVYSVKEVTEICAIAKNAGLYTHMDGARFGNAIAALGCSPADLTWRAGVDVLSFGATKGGALACEAVVFFNEALAEDFIYRRKRGGHLISKHRLLTAQMKGYLEDWLVNAKHANDMATMMAKGLQDKGIKIAYPVEANEVFPVLNGKQDAALKAAGASYYPWGDKESLVKPQDDKNIFRLVTSFATKREEVEAFLRHT